MSRSRILVLAAILAAILATIPAPAAAGELMVFTANQEWLSRIYVMDEDAHVIDYHEYEFYRFTGMEVVDGELYVAEAFAPRVYKVDPRTGALEVFIDDWSLYYFYDVAFDGAHFYLDEWDLNRYDAGGGYAGTAGFDEDVLGCAWDGQYLWTLDDTGPVRCWDLGRWPEVAAVTANDFAPPSSRCRGLWFDGEHFWSAESGDSPGYIYVFDHDGQVVQQWPEPAFSGWAAVMVPDPATAVDANSDGAAPACGLRGNYPNPFNPATTIRFELPRAGHARLSVHDAAGRLVRTLVDGRLAAGTHEVPWRAEGLASGIYLSRLKAGGTVTTAKMLLIE